MIIIALVILGLCLGSFVNATVYRLHWQEANKKARDAEKRKYSIAKGRSICPNCKRELSAKDLIPVFSWLILGGKCRYCNKPISRQYPIVEALTASLFVLSYVFWPYDLSVVSNITAFIFWLIFLIGFMILIIYDLKYLVLPNKVIFPLSIIAIIGFTTEILASHNPESILRSAIAGLLIGGGLFYLLFEISNGRWIGGGDVKLGFLLGFLIGGPWLAVLMLFLASLLGTLYSMPLLLSKKIKPNSRIPFGPFLIASAIIVQLFGPAIINWYTSFGSTGY